MDKQYYFIAGLPRSGSTLLCNLLAQNPRFYTTGTSGILEVLVTTRNLWDNVVEFRAMPHADSELRKVNVMRNILNGYFADVQAPVVFDKSRGWTGFIELAEMLTEKPPKLLVPVRDLRDVLASFEKLWRKNIAFRQFAQEINNFGRWQTLEGRMATWLEAEQPVGMAYNRIVDAVQRGHKSKMFFVEYDALTAHPKETMKAIYRFLGEEPFEHDFENVQQVTVEDDYMHGIPNLHIIRPKVEPQPSQWQSVIGDNLGSRFKPIAQFWKE